MNTVTAIERPILFKTPMVRAILAGKKTCTRRLNNLELINKNPDNFELIKVENEIIKGRTVTIATFLDRTRQAYHAVACSYGKVGDLLWVRETWAIGDNFRGSEWWWYKADSDQPQPEPFDYCSFKWKPSIHMPKDLCRLRLSINYIKIQRLQDISEEDAIAEGVESRMIGNPFYKNYLSKEGDYMGSNLWLFDSPIDSFHSLWQSINGANSWSVNPWVWAINFKIYNR